MPNTNLSCLVISGLFCEKRCDMFQLRFTKQTLGEIILVKYLKEISLCFILNIFNCCIKFLTLVTSSRWKRIFLLIGFLIFEMGCGRAGFDFWYHNVLKFPRGEEKHKWCNVWTVFISNRLILTGSFVCSVVYWLVW